MQKKTKKMTRASRQNIGYAYIAIWIIGFLVFKFYPFMSSLFYSFTNYNLFKESVENIGFANYEKIVDTAKYLKSYIVTFKYAFMTVPLKLLFALLSHIFLTLRSRELTFSVQRIISRLFWEVQLRLLFYGSSFSRMKVWLTLSSACLE